MNQQAQKYWDDFWQDKEKPHNKVIAENFGIANTPMADYLAGLVTSGIKTSTCASYEVYQHNGWDLPEVGMYSVILDSKDQPLCIIQTTSVEIIPMNEVGEEFAAAEGEGDLSHKFWWDTHEKYFTQELKSYGMEFREDMPLVCEWFKLIDVR